MIFLSRYLIIKMKKTRFEMNNNAPGEGISRRVVRYAGHFCSVSC